MQALKEDHPKGFVPDRAWFEAFIAKALLFREVQSIVKALRFPAYQANIAAYTVALISLKTAGVIDFHRIWTQQGVSPQMRFMIQDWAPLVEKELRRSAGSRMLSEWAKKVDCWQDIQRMPIQFSNPLPPEVPAISPGGQDSTLGGDHSKSTEELDHEELICLVRSLFNEDAEYERDTAISKLASQMGVDRANSPIRAEIDSALRTGVRRGILESSGDVLRLSARSIGDYSRDHLKAQFLASLPGSQWIERDKAIRAFARWMGFRRTGSAINESARSLINGLLRDDRLQRAGTRIRLYDRANAETSLAAMSSQPVESVTREV
jgi:AIPR protein